MHRDFRPTYLLTTIISVIHHKRKSFNIEREEQIQKAIIAYQNKEFNSVYTAVHHYNVNRYILAKRVAKKNSKI